MIRVLKSMDNVFGPYNEQLISLADSSSVSLENDFQRVFINEATVKQNISSKYAT